MPAKNTNGPQARAECKQERQSHGESSKCTDESQPVVPVNLPAERSVLGAILEDATLLPAVLASGLQVEHFLLGDHQRVFRGIITLHARSEPVDYISVCEWLGGAGHDAYLIGSLTHGVVIEENHVLNHVRIVKRNAQRRSLQKLGAWLAESITDTCDPELIIAHVQAKLESCSEEHVRA